MNTAPLRRLVVIGLLLAGCQNAEREPAGVPDAIRTQLAAGINVSRWFDHRDDPAYDPTRRVPSADELVRLKAAGLRHLRLTVSPLLLLENEQRGSLRQGAVQELRTAIARIRDAGLLTVLVVQPREGSKARISEQPTLRDGFARFWRALAEALQDIPPRHLVLELLNEPETEDAAKSRAMYVAVVAAVRKVLPEHTLVVSGHRWSAIEHLEEMQPLSDPNIVYGFHFYEPHNFTHQGADWGWPMWRKLAGLPYPSSPEAVAGRLEFLDAEAHPHVLHYGEQRWNRERLAAFLDRAVRYAREHQVPVWCSEFGVYRYNVHDRYRQAWLRDVRTLLEERLIGWSLWNYAGHFGLVSGRQGERRTNADDWLALGLDPAPFADADNAP